MRTVLQIYFKRITALVLSFTMLFALFSTYTFTAFSASDTENEYDRPWLWPVPGSYMINSLDTYTDGSLHNQGQALDIGSNGYRGSERLDVVSATDGEVFYIQKSYNETTNKGSGWGNYVVVRTGDTYILYAHLKTVTAKYGSIKAGDVIGKMGTTGNSTGVHLHVQAYPVGHSSTSTEIHIFDKFIDNPLYAEKFCFWAGLQKYSDRYGDTIRTYYKNVSDTYYTYSGGRNLKYDEESVSATVTTVNLGGTSVYSAPSFDAGTVKTIIKNTDVNVYGFHIDAYGNYWYNISQNKQDQWIAEKDVGFKNYDFSSKASNMVAPDDTYGTYADLSFAGNISSLNTITSIKAQIRKGYTVLSECTIPINESSYTIGDDLYNKLKITNMANGTYTFELFVTVSASFPGVDGKSSTYSLYKSEFKINSLLADSIPPLVENISVDHLDYSKVKLGAKVTDDRKIDKVEFTFEYVGSSFKKTVNGNNDGDYYYVEIPFTSLNGTGKYNVTVTGYDAYGNSDSTSYVITVPVKPKGEIWVVSRAEPSLRVRTGPGTSYSKAGSLYNGDQITVTEVVIANGLTWGHFDDGWCALDYCDYVSGSMFEITFDLNGGTCDNLVTSISKKYNEDVTLPTAVPKKNGLTFLGWSTNPSADKETYKAGEIYTENASKVLFAVWADNSSPVINKVVLSSTDWTKDGVTITVSASDDSGVVYYSFDGGKSWRRENTLFILENTELESGAIAVKDSFGNVVFYDKKITVSNIDLDAPIPSKDKVTVTNDENGTVISFGEALDELSGVSKYVLVYSHESNFEQTSELTVTNGMKLTLGSGIYYAKLYIYDKVDNLCIVDLDRFLIGDPVNLNSPSNFKILSSSSDSVVFVWDTVSDSDLYLIYISQSEDFSEQLCFESTSNVLTVTSLKAGIVYYAKIVASCSDGLFIDSPEITPLRFETISSDSTIHGFDSYPDAEIGENTVKITTQYADKNIDLSLTVHEKSVVKLYSDSALKNPITSAQLSFSSSSAVIYAVVTAENGDVRQYTVTFTRAQQSAQTPVVSFTGQNSEVPVGDSFDTSLKAMVSDGGELQIVWYLKTEGSDPAEISYEEAVSFTFNEAGTYKIYAVVTNMNEKCAVKTAVFTTKEIVITVKKFSSVIEVIVSDKDYDGEPIEVSHSAYEGDGEVKYRFYTDADCRFEVSLPVNAGTYYVKATASETDTYYAAESAACKLVISRAKRDGVPTYELIRPSLRDRNGYVTVTEEGIEYSINDSFWKKATPNESFKVSENDVVEIRFAVSDNYLASESVSFTVYAFNGTDDFYPNGNIDFSLTNEYMLINAHKITSNDLISSLEKTENVYITDENGNEVDGYLYTSCVIMIKDDVGVFKSLTIVILGDIDRDGVVSYDDALEVLKISNGVNDTENKLDLASADVDRDGRITSIDACEAYLTSKAK